MKKINSLINKKLVIKRKWLIAALLLILLVGGGLKIKINKSEFTCEISTEGVIKEIRNYENNSHDRDMQDKIYRDKIDSLKIENVNDAVTIFKLFSINKDSP